MVRAKYKGAILAESEQTRVVDGYHYFPPQAVRMDTLKASETASVCFWKGTARYWNVDVDGDVLSDAVWSYPSASDEAKKIEGWLGFWSQKGVVIEEG